MASGRVIKNIMKAICVRQFGGPEVLKVEENLPIPQPNDNQVLIKVYAAGVNPVDTYIRNGTYAIKPALPYTPGMDVSGTIEAVGKNVKRLKEGDRVFSIRTVTGGYAEYCVTDEDFTQLLDEKLRFEEGAGLGVPYYTAYRATIIRGRAKPGETVLIHGASGGVGLACVQLSRHIGLKVIGTAGSKAGMDLISNHGGNVVLNHKDEDYTKQIMDATNGEGPDLIIEMLANVNLEKDLNMIRKNGRIINVGSRGTVEISPRFTMAKECIVTGVILMGSSQEDWKEMHAAIQQGIKSGWVSPHVHKEYSLTEAEKAHCDVIDNTGAQGKLIIKI